MSGAGNALGASLLPRRIRVKARSGSTSLRLFLERLAVARRILEGREADRRLARDAAARTPAARRGDRCGGTEHRAVHEGAEPLAALVLAVHEESYGGRVHARRFASRRDRAPRLEARARRRRDRADALAPGGQAANVAAWAAALGAQARVVAVQAGDDAGDVLRRELGARRVDVCGPRGSRTESSCRSSSRTGTGRWRPTAARPRNFARRT